MWGNEIPLPTMFGCYAGEMKGEEDDEWEAPTVTLRSPGRASVRSSQSSIRGDILFA